ncbi:PREDICTED: sex peptide receptor-like [Priapulus caudatus]|uniref:Sex peptide receptor-like n=1 Tax=Priapulus caudatus TaxID=37621 RepID=A0ABM1E140_PRICU|nr:PREDICTED: sex peptide receptor-like [Priapulus caudatus]XP_014665911.1 PREDICTED: sex peptide receptor-like [Priapulus caudatus]XP_014665912.1 PREDICTED: sex peptide receptor-like [Priapulus caudatus]
MRTKISISADSLHSSLTGAAAITDHMADIIPTSTFDINATMSNSTTWWNMSKMKEEYGHDVVALHSQTPVEYAVPMLGYIGPVFIIFTVIFNTLVVIVLLKKHMRTSTNVLLTAMAVSDTLTGLVILPWCMYYYSFQNYKQPMSLLWCKIYQFTEELIPTIFHTASIWLTMSLAIQRYIMVCKTRHAKKWCSMHRVKWGIVFIYVTSILYNIPRFVDIDFLMVEVPWPMPLEGAWVDKPFKEHCAFQTKSWVVGIEDIYYNIYYWFRVVCVHFVPCTTLVVLNACLLNAMRKAQQRRKKLMQENRCSESKKLRDTNCTTAMLIVVVTVFLIVEIPTGIVFIFHILANTFQIQIMEVRDMNVVSLTTAFLIILSYPINFFIYCGMSKQFRNTFKQLFVKGDGRNSINSTREREYCTLNGNTIERPECDDVTAL